MTRMFAAVLRRTNRLMRPAKLGKATRSFQKSMAGFVISTALAPLAAVTPKGTKPRKPAVTKTGHSLGTVLKQLRAVQSLMPGAKPRPSGRKVFPRIPTGAQYLTRRHRSAMGSRGYKLYLPASQPTRPKGLIVMLHGCNQTPDDFAVGTHMNALAEKHGLAVAWPAQTKGHNAASCWNWFKPGNQGRGAGEPAILASLTRNLMREFGLVRDKVFVAGLSAGGAMAVILADAYPDVFSAVGVHSGLARGAARNIVTAVAAMRNGGETKSISPGIVIRPSPVRRIVFHGDADATVHPSNANMIVASALGRAALPTRIGKRAVRGRGYVRSEYAGLDGAILLELWQIEGAGHAWSGGRASGSYTDNTGPDASAQMVRFFLTKAG